MTKKLLLFSWGLTLFLSGASWALNTETLKQVNPAVSTTSLDKDYQLVLFWATWCGECKEKMTETFPRIQDKNFTIRTVNTESSVKRVQHFIKKHELPYEVFMDDSRALQKELKIFSVPAWAVYKKQSDGQWSLVKALNAFEGDKVNEALNREYF